ncbi:MAG: hypothetical protein RLZZ09_177 [Pseudomonadota bacterium]|jgi:uncharacterized protein (DUF924 family)
MRNFRSEATVCEEVLKFWFKELEPKQWWVVDPVLDAKIADRFGALLCSAAQGELYPWRATPRGRLAEVIVLDQFSRNVHRNTPAAFSQDPVALALSQEAIAFGVLVHLDAVERSFLLMPLMHSESPAIHVEAERQFKEWALPTSYEFELRHKAIIDRFGRYPHRNAILGRESTPEEVEFLKQPGSGF